MKNFNNLKTFEEWNWNPFKKEEPKKQVVGDKDDEMFFDKIDAKIRNNFKPENVKTKTGGGLSYQLGKYFILLNITGWISVQLFESNKLRTTENLILGEEYKEKAISLYNFIIKKYQDAEQEENKRIRRELLNTRNRFDELSERKRYKNKLNEENPFDYNEYEKYIKVKWTDDEIDTLIKLGADDIQDDKIIFIREYDGKKFVLSKINDSGEIEYEMVFDNNGVEMSDFERDFRSFIKTLKRSMSYSGPVRGQPYNGPYAKEIVDQWEKEAEEREKYPLGKPWWKF